MLPQHHPFHLSSFNFDPEPIHNVNSPTGHLWSMGTKAGPVTRGIGTPVGGMRNDSRAYLIALSTVCRFIAGSRGSMPGARRGIASCSGRLCLPLSLSPSSSLICVFSVGGALRAASSCTRMISWTSSSLNLSSLGYPSSSMQSFHEVTGSPVV